MKQTMANSQLMQVHQNVTTCCNLSIKMLEIGNCRTEIYCDFNVLHNVNKNRNSLQFSKEESTMQH